MKLGRAVGAGATLALVLAALNRHEPPEFENLRPIDVPIWLAIVGAAFGAGCAATVAALHDTPAPVAGAAWGLTFALGAECFYRTGFGRDAPPFMMRPRPLGVWAVYGAAVATLSR